MSDISIGVQPAVIDSNTWDKSALFAALAKAQGQFPEIPKNRSVRVSSSKGAYSFKYADLQQVIASTKPALSANGLCVIQYLRSDGADRYLVTTLGHASGQSITSEVKLPHLGESERPQDIGALITYFRRYQYNAMIGTSADDDLDERGVVEPAQEAQQDDGFAKEIEKLREAAEKGTEAYKAYWVETLSAADRKRLMSLHESMKRIAAEADKAKEAAGNDPV